jgi:ABC-2 type transport system ATP-binding protein
MDEVIVTQGLTRRYGDKVAVDHLDLRVTRGEVFGFLGPNGAGKTTTVRLLNGVLNASEGRASVLGRDVATQGNAIRALTGVLTESPSLYEALTAMENLAFFGALYGVPEDQIETRGKRLLDEFGLLDRANDKVGGYSKGMRQRLAMARALLHEPQVLFFDEPTAALDPVAARMVRDLIRHLSYREGRTVFLCTHNLTEAQELCSRVGVIDHGVLRAVGSPQELARQLWQGTWVELDLRGAPTAEVSAALDRLPAVRNRAAEDGRLALELDAEESIPDVVAAIAAAGGRIYGVTPRQHSLEEIYFQIEGHNGVREGGAA